MLQVKVLSAESRKGWGQEDVTTGRIMLKVVEMSENDTLNVEAGGVKDEDQMNANIVLSMRRGSTSRSVGNRGDVSEHSIHNSKGGNPGLQKKKDLRYPRVERHIPREQEAEVEKLRVRVARGKLDGDAVEVTAVVSGFVVDNSRWSVPCDREIKKGDRGVRDSLLI